MLTKISSDQIPQHWPAIQDLIKRSLADLPGYTKEKDNNLLQALLIEELVCWIIFEKFEEHQNTIIGMLLTKIILDELTGVRSLLLYGGTSWETANLNLWDDGYDVLQRYGKANECSYIVLYTQNEKILRMVSRLGGDTKCRFVTLPL